ncbi:MAG TPA: alanine racemase [Candidatus Limnocylindrales bacterium]
MPRTAWLAIDLDALGANLGLLRELAGGVPVFPVVKADAYGHGAVPVARALEAAGADGFCVAAYDEAVALREAGVTSPLLVLYPIPAALAGDAARREIGVTAGDPVLLERLVEATGRETVAPEPLAMHLEIETGLGRGGFDVGAAVAAAARIRATPGLRLASAWTHLQAAEDPDRTAAQLARVEVAVDAHRDAGHDLPRHLAASGGILEGGIASLDGVRPGLAIYGLVPDELLAGAGFRTTPRAGELRPVLSLRAQPVRVATLPAGTGISYGPTFTTTRESRIATLPLGYGDGWPRSLSNRAGALVRGVRAPIVGNVAMDALMVDVTDVPGEPVTVDDEFVLIGRQGDLEIAAADLARARSTNSWEVVTNMARRLPRVYHAASGPQGLRTLVPDPR